MSCSKKGESHDPCTHARARKNSTDYLMSCHLSKYIHFEQRIPWVGKHLNETWSTEISLKICMNESNRNRKERDRFRCYFSYLLQLRSRRVHRVVMIHKSCGLRLSPVHDEYTVYYINKFITSLLQCIQKE